MLVLGKAQRTAVREHLRTSTTTNQINSQIAAMRN